MSDPVDAALTWIRTAIEDERPQTHPDEVALLALTVETIASDYGVPVEEAIVWIHSNKFDADPDTWREHCRKYVELRSRLCSR